MTEQATTQRQIKRRYTRLMWKVSGSLLAAGAGLSLSVMFLGAGIVLMALAVAATLIGMGTVALIPRLITFTPRRCPFCEEENQVLATADGYRCDTCGAYVRRALDYPVEVGE